MGEVCVSVVWRVSNALMCVFFSLATYVQINDPDAALWMVGYGVPAVLCAALSFNPHLTETLSWRHVADLHVMVSSAVVLMLGWRIHGEKMWEIFHQEEGRECSGLLLTLVWLLLCRRSGRSPVGVLRALTAASITVFPFMAWLYYYVNTELRQSWPSHCKTAL